MTSPPPALTLVVPTYEERDNLAPFLAGVAPWLDGCDWNVVFVDDASPDGTASRARALGRDDPRVRVLCRSGRRGLSSAVLEGVHTADQPYVLVMDADLQHDPRCIPSMVQAVHRRGAELAVASRFLAGGSAPGLDALRLPSTALGNTLARVATGTALTDPLSGCFLARRSLFDEAAGRVTGWGFKILVDLLLALDRPVEVEEVPLVLRSRHHGRSKLDLRNRWAYMHMLLHHAHRRRATGRDLATG